MKKYFKRIICSMMAAVVLLVIPGASYAAGSSTAKDETVYALLDHDGSVKSVYVVNAFELSGDGYITDYGDYSSVRNLSTTEKLQIEDGAVNVSTAAGWFYYEGRMTACDMPWIITIKYYMDGTEVTADELAGADGKLKVQIGIKQSDSYGIEFADNYMLQVSLSLNTNKCREIEADGATITSLGAKKTVAFTLLPGGEDVFTVNAVVSDFEMDGIQIAGAVMGLDIDIDSAGLSDGVLELTDGIQKLDDGAAELASGSGEYKQGVDALADSSAELAAASQNVRLGLTQISEGLREVTSQSGNLSGGLEQIKSGMSQYEDGLNQLKTQTETLVSGSAQYSSGLSSAVDSLSDILVNAEALKTIAENLAGSSNAQTQSLAQGYLTLFDALTAFSDGLNQLNTQYAQIDSGVAQIYAAIDTLSSGIADIGTGLTEFEAGLTQQSAALSALSDGLNELAVQYPGVDNGVSQLAAGAKQLSGAYTDINDGISALKDGIDTLSENTGTLESDVNKKIEEMVGGLTNGDFTPVSFASSKNTNIGSVQFIMLTDEIAVDEAEPAQEETESLTFWQRFIALFT